MSYGNVRDFLGCFVGRTVVDVTQHDPQDFALNRQAFIEIMFDDASTIRFALADDGVSYNCETVNCALHPPEEPDT